MTGRIGLCLLATVAAAAGCGGKKPAATPDEVFARAQEASKADRPGDLLALFPPDDRASVTWLVMRGAKGVAETKGADAPACRQELEALLKKHGVDLEADQKPLPEVRDAKAIREAAGKPLQGVDLPSLFGDLVDFFGKHLGEKRSLKAKFLGTLKDVKIEGEKAAGTCDGMPVMFAKVGDGWYLRPDLE